MRRCPGGATAPSLARDLEAGPARQDPEREAGNRRPPLVPGGRRGPEPRPLGLGHRRDPARQALPLVHAPLRHRRLRRRGERREDRGDREEARREALLAALGLSGRDPQAQPRRAAGPPARGGHPPGGPGHAPEEQPGPRAADQAEGVCRSGPPARRAGADAAAAHAPGGGGVMAEAATQAARYRATGRRKSSVARVILTPGEGGATCNGRDIDEFFGRKALVTQALMPLTATGLEGRFAIIARLHGGGVSGQAGALRHGIARALVEADENLRLELKRQGFLTRDARIKERKKAGLKGARKRPQFSKR